MIKAYKYLFYFVIVIMILWLITDITNSLRALYQLELVPKGTVLERFYFIRIVSEILFMFIFAASILKGNRIILFSLLIPIFWLLHAYINTGKYVIENVYIIIPVLGIFLFSIREYISRRVGSPTDNV